LDEEIQHIDLGFVNAYLVKAGDGFILIDTGMAPQFARLEAQLLQAGCLPDHLKLVVITHGDMDHAGGCAALQAKYHARIAIHPADLAMATTGAVVKRQGRGLLNKIAVTLMNLVGGRATARAFQADILLQDGQGLEAYDLAAKVIHTPGHTQGSIAVVTEQGNLFAGDTLANRTRVDVAPFIQDYQVLRRSLERLKSLNAKMVYPGHGKPFPYEALRTVNV